MKKFEELVKLEKIIQKLQPFADIEVVASASSKDQTYPLYVIRMGSKKPKAPTIGYFAGVHGLERIGTGVLLAYLNTIADLMPWDKMLHSILKHIQFVFMPLINPVGMKNGTRSNGNLVDLMRNAPIDSEIVKWYQVYGGHRLTKHLPWYRGEKGNPMEVEAQAVCDVVQKYLMPSNFSLSLDIHSGFGVQDQIWFPYAYTRKAFPYLAQAYRLKNLLDQTYPAHVYRFEPQSIQYQTHGDLWDYACLQHLAKFPKKMYIPLTLELGSWTWMKKRPSQIFSLSGLFNPIKPHRQMRTMRRHLVLFDFLTRAVVSNEVWAELSISERLEVQEEAKKLWPQVL